MTMTTRTITQMFCVFHKEFYLRNDNYDFIFFGVNETYPKSVVHKNVILEYDLKIYNPFLQKRGYMETSAYLHVYWNQLYLGKDMIGFSQYDMFHHTKYENLEKDCIYLMNTGRPIVENGKWCPMMCPDLRNLDFLIQSYNGFFYKNYSIRELENMPLSLWQTGIYPVGIYEKLCRWLEVLVEEIYPWSNLPPYETHFGSIGGYTERALSIFNAFAIYEGCQFRNLHISHGVVPSPVSKEQYNTSSFLNFYSQDIHCRFVNDITGKYQQNYSMFKACCELDGVLYSCERVNRVLDGKTGLYFLRDGVIDHMSGFDIEAEDPRIFVCDGRVYVVFICINGGLGTCGGRGIAITPFDKWRPVFLRVDGMNGIEKNWAPFVKNNELYFVYNYDPLVILKYDLTVDDGICSVVCGTLPMDTSAAWLRGGSNLIPYLNDSSGYFIGGCHSRIDKTDWFEHYTHIVVLDTNLWKLLYVSKPVMYCIGNELKGVSLNSWWVHCSPSTKPLDTLHNILMDKTPHIIQDPISFYMKDGKYYITINVRDCVTLLYEISFANLFDFANMDFNNIHRQLLHLHL
jgi:hypothetical protein